MKNKRPWNDWNKALLFFCVFLLSFVRLSSGVAPFGLPALLCAGAGDPLYLIAFVAGRFFADVGAGGFFRGILAAGLLVPARLFCRRMSEALLCALAVLTAGALVLVVRPSLSLAADAGAEALIAGVFFVVFREAKALLSDRYRLSHMTSGELFMLLCAASAMLLSLADVSIGPLSPAAALVIALAMAVSYRQEAITSAALALSAGCAFLVFVPQPYAEILCLSLASALSSVCRKYRWGVPLCFLSVFALFSFAGQMHLSLWDAAFGGAVFCLIPARLFDRMRVSPGHEAIPLRLKEKLSGLSDAFAAMAAMFAPRAAKGQEAGRFKAAASACKAVCSSCPAGVSCSASAREALSASTGPAPFSEPRFLAFCRRRSALRVEFAAAHRLARQDELMHMALREEGAALSGQMTYLSGVLGRLADEEPRGPCRNDSAERALGEAFRRAGVRAGDVACGLWPSGALEVTLCVSGCDRAGLCDTRIPKLIGEVMGCSVERLGLKPCDSGGACRLRYGALSSLAIHPAMVSFPLAEESGDAFAALRIDEHRFALILSDGMGTGAAAADMSRTVVELSARLLSVGMDIETVVAMVNTLLLSRTGGRGFATLDMAVIDLETGLCRYVKNGAAEGCILHPNGRAVPLSGEGSPLGTIASVRVRVQKTDIKDGDMLILATDGASDALAACGGLTEYVKEFTAGSAEDLASFIARGAYASLARAKDDITVVAAGCIKRAAFGKDRHIWDGETKPAPIARKRGKKQRRIEA